jgi:hypothetical protein
VHGLDTLLNCNSSPRPCDKTAVRERDINPAKCSVVVCYAVVEVCGFRV